MHFSGICFKLRSGRNNYEKCLLHVHACMCLAWTKFIIPLFGEGNGTHSSTLAWKIPWMEEPGGLQFMGLLGVGRDWVTSLSLFTFHFHALEKAMATHSSVLAWRIPGTGEPVGLPSMGSHRVGLKWLSDDWSDLAAAAANLLLCIFIILISKTGIQTPHEQNIIWNPLLQCFLPSSCSAVNEWIWQMIKSLVGCTIL